MDFLTSLQQLRFITWVRESESLLGYTLYLAGHTIGMVALVGPNLLIAARVLGLAPALPLAPMAAFRPIMNVGLWITVVTGSVLFATAPVGYVANTVFLVKIAAVLLAVGCLRIALREIFGRGVDPDAQPVSIRAQRWTAASVLLWAVAVVAGRLTAYSGVVVLISLAAFLLLVVVTVGVGWLAHAMSRRSSQRAHAFRIDMHAAPVKEGK